MLQRGSVSFFPFVSDGVGPKCTNPVEAGLVPEHWRAMFKCESSEQTTQNNGIGLGFYASQEE